MSIINIRKVNKTVPSEMEQIDLDIEKHMAVIAKLQQQKKILEFSKDPDAYEKKLLNQNSEKEGSFLKPNGSFRSIEYMILEIFKDNPNKIFYAGTILSELLNRGWLTRNRSPKNAVSIQLSLLFKAEKIKRLGHGTYVSNL